MSVYTEPVRIGCDAEGFEQNYIDVSPRWTQAEVQALAAIDDDAALYALLRAKTVACHIEAGDGAITEPDGITPEAMRNADMLLIGWIGRVLPLAVAQRRALGNASARLSSRINAAAKMQTPTTAAPTTT